MIGNSTSQMRRIPLAKSTSIPATNVADDIGHDRTHPCRLALIGFGTVGRAVARILCESGKPSLRLAYICNRNVEKKKQALEFPSDVVWTDDVESVLKSDVDIVIELIGGLHSSGADRAKRAGIGKIGGHGQ